MYKPSTYLAVTYFLTYLSMRPISYRIDFQSDNQNINSLDVHPQLSNKGHPLDGLLAGAGSL
jgi:hypothetical protein